MSGTNIDPESNVATVQDPPDTELNQEGAADEAPTESRASSEVSTERRPEATSRAGRLSPTARRLVPIALVVLVSASATAVGLLGWQAIRAGNAEQNTAAALDAARTGTSQTLSYESATLDADLARARTQLAEPFATRFAEQASSVIVPAAQQQTIATRTEILRSAVIDAQPARVEALLFLRRTSSTATQPQPQQELIEVRVTMTKNPDGQWLIADLQNI